MQNVIFYYGDFIKKGSYKKTHHSEKEVVRFFVITVESD